MINGPITVVQFEQTHLSELRSSVKECHQGEYPTEVYTRALTLMCPEGVAGIVGAFCPCPGVMHIWALISDRVRKYPISFYKNCLQLMEYYRSTGSLQRMQIEIRHGYPDLIKWANALGFQQEGIMRSYGADRSDYYLFGKVY